MASSFKWTVRLGLLTLVLAAICVFMMGGGHGWYTPTMVLFPWAMVNLVWQDHLSEPLLLAGIFQFLLYGFIVDKTNGMKSQRVIIASVWLSHITLAILILVLKNPDWR